MMELFDWITQTDWRACAGLFFSMHLVVWSGRGRRRCRPGRAAAGVLALCAAHWCACAILERSGVSPAVGHAACLLGLGLLYGCCCLFCRQADGREIAFHVLMAVTMWQAVWNGLKLLPVMGTARLPLSWAVCLLACVGGRRLFRRVMEGGDAHARRLFLLALCAVLLCGILPGSAPDGGEEGLLALTALLACGAAFLLLALGARQERQGADRLSLEELLHSKQRYDELSRENVAALQVKCHDLKHQLAKLRSEEGRLQVERYIGDLERAIEQYSTVMDSGNRVVDAVLTEKSVICSGSGIRFTCMIDGTLFDPLPEPEIRALFGNVMDNALEAMEGTVHAERRFLSLKAARRGGLVILSAENYFERELSFRDGLPVTTKREKAHHGFGLRSIREIAQRHGGEVSVKAEDQVFRLTVSMRLEGVEQHSLYEDS